MIKVKILEDNSSDILEEKVNKFIEDKNIKDIRCTSSTETYDFGTEMHIVVMIVYDE